LDDRSRTGGRHGEAIDLFSDDAGKTWRSMDGPSPQFGDQLNFIDLSTGFVVVPRFQVGAGQLLRTNDEARPGRLWSP